MTVIPESWLPKVPMSRIIWHWTAGAYTPNSTDKAAYHFLVDGDGKWHRGVDIAKNSGSLKSGYAAHTLNCNTNSIGVSLCCMANAVESPFDAGKYPMKRTQIDSLVEGTREIAAAYGIAVGRKTMLSHAEVQPTLGIAQRQKWDYTRLPFDDTLRGAHVVGDWLRGRVAGSTISGSLDPVPASATLVALRGTPTRSAISGDDTGFLPTGTAVTALSTDGDWVFIRTPGGYEVWAPRAAFEVVNGPAVEASATPSNLRTFIDEMRRLLDKMETEIGT